MKAMKYKLECARAGHDTLIVYKYATWIQIELPLYTSKEFYIINPTPAFENKYTRATTSAAFHGASVFKDIDFVCSRLCHFDRNHYPTRIMEQDIPIAKAL